MQRLIDADALIDAYCNGCTHYRDKICRSAQRCDFESFCNEYINTMPTIEAVPKEKILLFLNIANEELSKAHANKSANGIVTWSASVTTLEGLLKEYDTADTDIVPVIRCRDCKWYKADEYEADYGDCTNDMGMCNAFVYGNDYCSQAERKPPQVNPEMTKALLDRIEKQRGKE